MKESTQTGPIAYLPNLIDSKEEDAGQFDWDAVNNDEDVELCLIRIPEADMPTISI